MASTAQFSAAMEAPVIEVLNAKIVVSLAVPKSAAHVLIYLFEGDDEVKLMVPATGVMLPPGAVGRAWRVTPSQRTPFTKLAFTVEGLKPDVKYTATFCARESDEISFGPESPRSLPKTFTLPKAPAMPVVLPADNSSSANVYFSAPFSANAIEIVFTNEAGDEIREKHDVPTAASRSGHKKVSGLELGGKKYTVVVFSLNGAGRTPSPSTSYCSKEFVPIAPCAPDVEVLGDTSMRVSYTVPLQSPGRTGTSNVAICFETGGKLFLVHAQKMVLVSKEVREKELRQVPFGSQNNAITVTGLTADTTYAISVRAGNAFGSSLQSPKTTVTTEKSEVEVTRVRSSEERDAELIKGAVDVDGENAAPSAKRAKQAPRNLEYVAIEPKEQMRKPSEHSP